MDTQLSLPLAPQARSTAADDADHLARWLAGRGWVSSQAIAEAIGWTDRRVRAAASASSGRILSSPGQPGYCLTREATADDRDRCLRAIRSQARQMLSRYLQLSRVHRAAGAP